MIGIMFGHLTIADTVLFGFFLLGVIAIVTTGLRASGRIR